MEVDLRKVTHAFNSYIMTDDYDKVFNHLNINSEDIESFKQLTCNISGKNFLENDDPTHSVSDADGNFDWFMIPEKFVEPMKEHFQAEIERLSEELTTKGYILTF